MKKDIVNIKLVSGLLVGMLIGGATVVCANQAIQAIQNDQIKISLNGEIQTFKDETTGEVQYPITYHDRTYLPLRNMAQLAGLNVDYDGIDESYGMSKFFRRDYKIVLENGTLIEMTIKEDHNDIKHDAST